MKSIGTKHIVLLAFLVLGTIAMAQNKEAENAYYRSQYTRWYKAALKDTNDIYAYCNLAKFYRDEKNPMGNLPLAMKYITKAEKKYTWMLESGNDYKVLRKLLKKGVTLQSIRDQRKDIEEAALKRIEEGNLTVVEIDQYIEVFSNNKNIVKQAGLQRVGAAYRAALLENTVGAYSAFIKSYPGTNEAEQAEAHIALLVDSLLIDLPETGNLDAAGINSNDAAIQKVAARKQSHSAFLDARKEHSVQALKDYMAEYPSSPDYLTALMTMDTLLQEEFETLKSTQEYADFALKNSESAIAEKAIDELYRRVKKEHDVQAARLFLKHFALDARYEEVYRQMYDWHAQEGNRQPIAAFAEEYKDFPFQLALKQDLNDGADIDRIDLTENFDEEDLGDFAAYIKLLTGKGISFVVLQRLLQHQILTQNWGIATSRWSQFDISFVNHKTEEYAELGRILAAPYNVDKEARLEFAPDADVTSIALTPNGTEMYYTHRDDTGKSHIRKAKRNEESWEDAGAVKFSNSENEDLQVFSLFDDGTKMLVGNNGDILIAEWDKYSWRIAEIPAYPLNTDHIETDAIMLPDGTGMLLASDRKGGYNVQTSHAYYHGDSALATDIYYVPRTRIGWGEPINLGPVVNSQYSERSPILSKDMLTLYFVTDSRGLGYGDIYAVHRSNASDWTSWQSPKNIGKELNSGFDEGSIALSDDEARLYACSKRLGKKYSSYSIPTGRTATSHYRELKIDVSAVSGSLIDCKVYDISSGALSHELGLEGISTILLPKVKQYAVCVRMTDRWSPIRKINDAENARIKMDGVPISHIGGRKYPLEMVTFDATDTKISAIGEIELDALAQFMKKNPSVSIDIIINVPGNDEVLAYSRSVKRGNQVRSKLAEMGVEPSRMTSLGYGNTNCQNSQKASIEIKFKVE